DLDLPVGKIRIKRKGSAAGHKGLVSIIKIFDSNEIPRIRIGIDHPPEGIEVVDYVLGRFNKEQKEVINKTLDELGKVIETILEDGYEQAMNVYN
ncbi:MAG: aminoacyl-tRNA hydrolase, partial [Halanaerobiaceae bacterium]